MNDGAKKSQRLRDWFVHLLHLDDSAHRIALGAAVGMFVAMTPTVGFQMLLTLLVLLFIPGNRAAGLPIVWITNPATVVPIYYFNYRIGVFLLGEPEGVNMQADWRKVVDTVPSLGQLFTAPSGWVAEMWQWLGDLWYAMSDIMGQLWLGSILVGLAAGLVAYGLMHWLVRFYRGRIAERLHRLAELRAIRQHRHAERRRRKAEAGAAAEASESSDDASGTDAPLDG